MFLQDFIFKSAFIYHSVYLVLYACLSTAVPGAASYNKLHHSPTKQVLALFHVPNVKDTGNRKLVSNSGFLTPKGVL